MNKLIIRIVFGMILMLWMPRAIMAQMRPIEVECGDTIQGELDRGGEHTYRLPLYVGDTLELELVADGWPNAKWELRRSNNRSVASDITTFESYLPSGKIPIEVEDEYLIFISAEHPSRAGTYTLYITCTFADGTVAEPASTSDELEPGVTEAPFSGFGFPGVAAIDFSAGIEIPLQPDQVMTVPIGNDVVLYTFEANGDSSATLRVERVSGDISAGITVIHRDTNEIVFLGGLPSSDNLIVDLGFPSDGVYVVGLFRFDTLERTNTSGAVQLSIE